MTLQLRPTFSESWYRVKDLAPRLRPTAQITRQHFRGERWYVVRDPAGNQYHRLSDAAYRFVGLLDGSRTVGQAWELVGGQLADDAPTQPEVIQILTQLYAANLIETNISPDATVLLRRHKQQQKKKMQGRLMNLLFPRMPIWDPDSFLRRWMPVVRPLLSGMGMLLWIAVVGTALILVIPKGDELAAAARSAVDLSANPENAIYLYACFGLIKFIHELGHGFFCRRFGGECHEMGIMLLVLVPCPYVDASSAWGFQSKWHRVLVGAGGMIFEVFVAALAAFVWLATRETELINQLAYNVMLIASVSTVLFNANPLLRYDGYYILSDWWEIPNLQRKASEYALGIVKRHVFRVKSQQPLPPVGQRVNLFVYAIASTVYRVFIGFAIMLLVLFQLPEEVRVLGLVMGLGAIATFFVVPAYKLVKYLALDPELHRKRGRAWAFTLAVVTAVVLFVGVLPWEQRARAQAVIEPLERDYVRVTSPGFVDRVLVADGQEVESGQALVRLSDPRQDAAVEKLRAQVRQAEIEVGQAQVDNPAQYGTSLERLELYRSYLADEERKQAELVIRSPRAGRLISPNLDQLAGRFLQTGEQLATVDVRDTMVARATFGQSDAQLLMSEGALSRPRDTELRLVSDPAADPIYAISTELSPASTTDVRHPSLMYAGGGELAPDPSDQTGTKAASQQWQMKVRFGNPGERYLPDQRAYVRVTLDRRPLIFQWERRLRQLIMSAGPAGAGQTGGAF